MLSIKHLKLFAFVCLVFFCSGGQLTRAVPAPTPPGPGAKAAPEKLTWVNIEKLGLRGIAWPERQHPFDRLPAKARGKVTDAVWKLGQNSAGIHVRFRSNARTLKVKWHLRFNNDLNHMAATGVKGLDLYVKAGTGWRWAAVGRPSQVHNEATMLTSLPGTEKEYLLYLPLYDGVDSVSVGVDPGATVLPVATADKKPIVFYGTSIVQGACASRPGMAYPAIIGRSLDREPVNLGFSGNGKLDVAIAELLTEVDAGLYVLDCLPNLQPEEVQAKTEAFVKALRAAKPLTPILLVENIQYAHDWIKAESADKVRAKNSHYRQAYAALKQAGVRHLYYLDNKNLTPADDEGAVDGVHLTDYGFKHLAGVLEKTIRKINK